MELLFVDLEMLLFFVCVTFLESMRNLFATQESMRYMYNVVHEILKLTNPEVF